MRNADLGPLDGRLGTAARWPLPTLPTRRPLIGTPCLSAHRGSRFLDQALNFRHGASLTVYQPLWTKEHRLAPNLLRHLHGHQHQGKIALVGEMSGRLSHLQVVSGIICPHHAVASRIALRKLPNCTPKTIGYMAEDVYLKFWTKGYT